MKEHLALPDISIKIDLKAKAFLKEIEKISEQSKNIVETRSQWDELFGKDYFIVAFKPVEQRGNIDLIGQLIFSGEGLERIQVEIRGFTETPSYDEYVTCANKIVKPLIAEYNKKNKKRFRVTVHKQAIKPYKLPPVAQRYFNRFTIFPDSTHPSDKKSFYMFVKFCHQNSVNLSGYQLKELMLKEGFTEKKAKRFQDIYTNGREILAVDVWRY